MEFLRRFGLLVLLTACSAESSLSRSVPKSVAFWGSSTGERIGLAVGDPVFQAEVHRVYPGLEVHSFGRSGGKLHELIPLTGETLLQANLPPGTKVFAIAARNDELVHEAASQTASEAETQMNVIQFTLGENFVGGFVEPFPVNLPDMAQADEDLDVALHLRSGLAGRVIRINSCYPDFSHLDPEDNLHLRDVRAEAAYVIYVVSEYSYGRCLPPN